MRYLRFIFMGTWLGGAIGLCADHYVAQNGQTPDWPHTNWTTAASNIQDAVNAAANGAVVWVADGAYYLPTNAYGITSGTNVVFITNALTLRSVNGAEFTMIDGGGSNRCVNINLAAAACAFGPVMLDGFTLTNGYAMTRGGGLIVYGAAVGTGVVQNCVIDGNVVGKCQEDNYAGGGGIYCYNAMNFAPVVSNCQVRGNRSVNAGALTNVSGGGGLWFRAPGQLVDCEFVGNETEGYGGGIYLNTPRSVLDRCLVVSNTSAIAGGGIYERGAAMELRNSLVACNTAPSGAGLFIYSSASLPVYNCTVVSNVFQIGNSVFNGDMQNNLITYFIVGAGTTVTGYNNCLPSLPAVGEWNNTLVTTNNPDYIGFIDSSGDFRLRRNSPCVNAGLNQAWLAGTVDLDGRHRIDPMSGRVDIGCYEFLLRGSFFCAH